MATVFLWCAPASGFVSIRERGLWPTDWPVLLESCRDRAKTFEISTGVRENVYEIGFGTLEEFDRVWPAIFVGAFLVNVSIAGSIASSLGVATGNTLEALTMELRPFIVFDNLAVYLVDPRTNGLEIVYARALGRGSGRD